MTLKVASAPLRISFLGGGTDYPGYFEESEREGCVIGSSINHYVYVSALDQPPFEEVKFRFTYRKTDAVGSIPEISHPVVRAILTQRQWVRPLNLATMATLPGRSGLGSSSAFTVALIRLMDNLQGAEQSPKQIAQEAVGVERNLLLEAGGYQDQYHSAIGGFRFYNFSSKGVSYSEPISTESELLEISKSLVLVATGKTRNSTLFAEQTTSNLKEVQKLEYGDLLSELTRNTYTRLLASSTPGEKIEVLADAMNVGWGLKKTISGHKSSEVDDLIKIGKLNGAISGKLCGAGGSGFALFIVPRNQITNFAERFNGQDLVFPQLTSLGVSIAEV